MKNKFKAGDAVKWNASAGQIKGTVEKKITSTILFKGHRFNASKEAPQYLVKSGETGCTAIHKGDALEKI